MKKILAVLALFLSFNATQAQELPEQFDPTSIKRVNVWDYPRTDSFMFTKDMKPVLAYTAPYMPVYLLASPSVFDTIASRLADPGLHAGLPSNVIIGVNYAVDYVKDYSLYTKKQMRQLELTLQQKMVLEAFNTKAKYTILAESPYLVYGVRERDPQTGEIRIRQLLPEEVFAKNNTSSTVENKTPEKKEDKVKEAEVPKKLSQDTATVDKKNPPAKKPGTRIFTIDKSNKGVY